MLNLIKQGFRKDRFFIYFGFFLFGLFSFKESSIEITTLDYFLSIISFAFLFMFQIILNDINDEETDKINKKNIIINTQYKLLGLIYLVFGLSLSYLVGNLFFQLSILLLLIGILYSQKPIRLKKYFPISNINLGIYTGVAFLLGFFLTHNQLSIDVLKIFITIVIYFSLVSIVKDFDDVYGDDQENLYTLPVILNRKTNLSEKEQYKIFYVLYFLLLASVSMFLDLPYLLIGILTLLFAIMVNIKEKWTIIMLTLSGWIIFLYLFLK